MTKTRILAVLSAMVFAASTTQAQPLAPEARKGPGDKRGGEETEIRQREEWFRTQRGLDEVYRPGALRSDALEEQKWALSQPYQRSVPGTWVPLGPSPMNMLSWAMGRVAGRVSALAVSPASESVLYLGTASGGLWKTVDGGVSWSSLFDSIGTQTIGSVAIDPNNSAVVWVGTGEQSQDCFDYFGLGLFRSSDGGITFQPANGSGSSALELSYVSAVAVQPGNSSLVLAGGPGLCSGGATFGGGLYRSTDGGANWTLVLAAGQANDVIFDPFSPAIVYAAMGQGWAAPGAGVYKSTDGGASWSLLSNGLPSGFSAGRIRLAQAPTSNLTLYALVNRGSTLTAGLYRSLDGGASWSLRHNTACNSNEQCTYNLSLAVSPSSSNTLLVGTIRLRRSTDGGTTLSYITDEWGSNQKVHQDTHVVRYSTTNGNRYWVGSDGGLWRTDNNASSWANLNANLNITQLYDVAVHPTNASLVWGGSQDNSSERRSTSNVWDVVRVTGDGFVNAIDPGSFSRVFIESYPSTPALGLPAPYGPNIYRSTSGGAPNSFSLLPKTGISAGADLFPWETKFQVLPTSAAGYLVTGSTNIYRANGRAGTVSWTNISGTLSSQALSAIGHTEATGSTLYLGFHNGLVFRTDNYLAPSVVWSNVTGGLPAGRISDIGVDPTDRKRVFVTRAAFGGSKLYRSTVGGTTWTAVGGGLPDVPANAVVVDPINRQRVFVGTDLGVYVSEDSGDSFAPQMAGMPLGVVVTDLEIDRNPHVLTAGTYGRGAWQLALPADFGACVLDGGADDILSQTSCCSFMAVTGSLFCANAGDASNGWASCYQICATPPVGGCVPSGGIDDLRDKTRCCSHQSVPGSGWCLNASDWNTSELATCIQTCL